MVCLDNGLNFKEGKITVEEVADNILNQNGIYEDLNEWNLYIDKI